MKASWAVIAISMLAAGCATPHTAPGECALAMRYIEAANASQPAVMEPFIADDASAIFLTGKPLAYSNIDGKAEVLDAIGTYTQQCESCRSELTCLYESEDAIYVTEHVRFIDQDGVEREQSAPLVLELENGKVIRLIYFPSTQDNGGT